jgi:hypothetical protein
MFIGYYYSETIDNSFWDTQTSGMGVGYNLYDANSIIDVQGLSTTQMQDINTFLDASWDFVDETDNGTDDIWTICNGQDYPRFQWEQRSCPEE